MKVRQHRGSLDDSMATCFEVQNKQELVDEMSNILGYRIADADVSVEYYAFDQRINWDTYLVKYKNHAFGFADGMIS